ncbi:MAG TPA: HupE/UreJ family protein, partial [Variovorax sp.]|nr:HupE/UreJ family protein [Variovorax sp.]
PPPAAARAPGAGFFQDGVHHILIGYDHVLFLVCLLLPAVLRRRADGGREPVARWREAVWPMVGLVTMFTIAHSITLALASFQLVTISPRVVEPAIALTIMVAALDNLHPVLRGRRRLFSFLFGLIHGFGFASVLGELDLPALGFASALLRFNLGVEAGQLVIVSAVLAVLLALRRWRAYPAVVLRGGSVLAIGLATLWLVERVFDLRLISA